MRKCVRQYIEENNEHPMYNPSAFVTWAETLDWSAGRKMRFNAFICRFKLEEPETVAFNMSRTRLRFFAEPREVDVVKDSKMAVMQIMRRLRDEDRRDVITRLSLENYTPTVLHVANLERYVAALEYSLQTQKRAAAEELASVRMQLTATIATLNSRISYLENEISMLSKNTQSVPSVEEIESFFGNT